MLGISFEMIALFLCYTRLVLVDVAWGSESRNGRVIPVLGWAD